MMGSEEGRIAREVCPCSLLGAFCAARGVFARTCSAACLGYLGLEPNQQCTCEGADDAGTLEMVSV